MEEAEKSVHLCPIGNKNKNKEIQEDRTFSATLIKSAGLRKFHLN